MKDLLWSAMNEKKRKQKLNSDLDNFLLSTKSEQVRSYGAALEKMGEKDFEKIDAACTRLISHIQYANITTRVNYNDGLEILAKLGMFLVLLDVNGKDLRHG